MKNFGIILSSIGVLALLFTLNMNTAVETAGGMKINNLGLMNDKQNYLIVSGILLVIGVLIFLFSTKNNNQNANAFVDSNKKLHTDSFKSFLPWIIGVVVIFGIYSWIKGINNTAVTLSQTVEQTWGDVQTSYQRRNDLIGNLVNTVKGAADFEKSTLTAVIEARAKATSITVDPTNITPEQLNQFNQAQSGVSSSLSRLLVTVEQYPELKANANFLKLQDELASTENQILTARTRFNEAVMPYNTHIKTFPNNLFAGMFGFKEKAYFQSVAGAEKPVEVKF